MRPKGMICQNLLLTLKLCLINNFHSSSTRFAVYLHSYISNISCKFQRICLICFDCILKILGPVFIESTCTSFYMTFHFFLAVSPATAPLQIDANTGVITTTSDYDVDGGAMAAAVTVTVQVTGCVSLSVKVSLNSNFHDCVSICLRLCL